MSRTTSLPFHELTAAVTERRRSSIYGHISGLCLDRAAPGEAWATLPYRPVFIGDAERGVLHGGVITAMLDESCEMAVRQYRPRAYAAGCPQARDVQVGAALHRKMAEGADGTGRWDTD